MNDFERTVEAVRQKHLRRVTRISTEPSSIPVFISSTGSPHLDLDVELSRTSVTQENPRPQLLDHR